MIDPVKLAEIQMDACYAATDQGRSATFRDTATALRLLEAYAEAAGAEVEAWRKWYTSIAHAGDVQDVTRGSIYDAFVDRTDAARAALVAAGIRVGGGA